MPQSTKKAKDPSLAGIRVTSSIPTSDEKNFMNPSLDEVRKAIINEREIKKVPKKRSQMP